MLCFHISLTFRVIKFRSNLCLIHDHMGTAISPYTLRERQSVMHIIYIYNLDSLRQLYVQVAGLIQVSLIKK